MGGRVRNMLIHSLEIMRHMRPIQASQVMRPSVWMLPNEKAITKPTATKMAVQAPCVDKAFSEMEILSMPEAEANIQTVRWWYEHMFERSKIEETHTRRRQLQSTPYR
jgi:hypothetical protein